MKQLRSGAMPLEILDDKLPKYPNGDLVEFNVPILGRKGEEFHCYPDVVSQESDEEEEGQFCGVSCLSPGNDTLRLIIIIIMWTDPQQIAIWALCL